MSEADAVRSVLLGRARADERVVAAAVTGSAARNAQDRWSDVDLFLGIAEHVSVADVLREWTEFLVGELGALHFFDLPAGAAHYRAFLLPSLLEVDLGFTPASDFAARGDGGFDVVFGRPGTHQCDAAVDVGHVAGLCWHHVLHARISIERGHLWQAEHWVSAVRGHVFALACARRRLPTAYAKGADQLPVAVRESVRETLVSNLNVNELRRALAAVTWALLQELQASDEETAEILRLPLLELSQP
jgi:hypothetical protein